MGRSAWAAEHNVSRAVCSGLHQEKRAPVLTRFEGVASRSVLVLIPKTFSSFHVPFAITINTGREFRPTTQAQHSRRPSRANLSRAPWTWIGQLVILVCRRAACVALVLVRP